MYIASQSSHSLDVLAVFATALAFGAFALVALALIFVGARYRASHSSLLDLIRWIAGLKASRTIGTKRSERSLR